MFSLGHAVYPSCPLSNVAKLDLLAGTPLKDPCRCAWESFTAAWCVRVTRSSHLKHDWLLLLQNISLSSFNQLPDSTAPLSYSKSDGFVGLFSKRPKARNVTSDKPLAPVDSSLPLAHVSLAVTATRSIPYKPYMWCVSGMLGVPGPALLILSSGRVLFARRYALTDICVPIRLTSMPVNAHVCGRLHVPLCTRKCPWLSRSPQHACMHVYMHVCVGPPCCCLSCVALAISLGTWSTPHARLFFLIPTNSFLW